MKSTFWVTMPERGFYFRIGGYGFAFDNNLPVLFSERYGYRKVWRVGRWALQWLRPSS